MLLGFKVVALPRVCVSRCRQSADELADQSETSVLTKSENLRSGQAAGDTFTVCLFRAPLVLNDIMPVDKANSDVVFTDTNVHAGVENGYR
jgi:hypothetical protein